LCRGKRLLVVYGGKVDEFGQVPEPWEPKRVRPFEEIRKIEPVSRARNVKNYGKRANENEGSALRPVGNGGIELSTYLFELYPATQTMDAV